MKRPAADMERWVVIEDELQVNIGFFAALRPLLAYATIKETGVMQ